MHSHSLTLIHKVIVSVEGIFVIDFKLPHLWDNTVDDNKRSISGVVVLISIFSITLLIVIILTDMFMLSRALL